MPPIKGGGKRKRAIRYLDWIVFFFILRPGEYLRSGANTDHRPLLLQYLQFFNVQKPFNTASTSASPAMQACAEFVSILFATQKMVPRDSQSATSEQATPKSVQRQHYIAGPHIFNTMAPPARILLHPSATRTSGSRFVALRSWLSSVPSSDR